MIFQFLEKNVEGFSRKTFAVLLMQLLLIAMAAMLFFRGYIDFVIFIAIELCLLLVYAELLFIELRKTLAEGFWKYVLFFAGIAAIIQIAWVVDFMALDGGTLQRFVYVLVVFVVFVVGFRFVFGRNYTTGKVLIADGDMAVVETEFDLLSFTSAGKYIVENTSAKRGQKVKVEIKGILFSGKPSRIAEIVK
jgi:uncharacterized membrane protein